MKKKSTKAKPLGKVNDVFLNNEEKTMFIITDVSKYPKGNLYTLKELGPKDEISYKRYYQDKLKDKCTKVKDAKAAKILYGKK